MNDFRQFEKIVVVTGGAGFIGSNLLLRLVPRYPEYLFINVDALTYAGNLKNLSSLESADNYIFRNIDITDATGLEALFSEFGVTHVLHLAAESHVDRSIKDPLLFVRTNVLGTVNLLNTALAKWEGNFSDRLFYHISTDEVYGSLSATDSPFTENTPYDPHSPYSASKAGSDHFVRAYHDTYGLPTIISNCSNNYGPYQFPEKLIPLCILNILQGRDIPIYGDGCQVRDWLYVDDHVDAIDAILHKGKVGETYNIGGNNEMRNIDMIKMIISLMDKEMGNSDGHSLNLMTFVRDRLGHDVRYAIDASRLRNEIGFVPRYLPEEGLQHTVEWYLQHQDWLKEIISGEYKDYYRKMYDL
ncbi:dTDP-glucose 4,6-dehydratase [Porphyromonas sp.]|uniref:dTDP-glucose 4,6-dehydratase n=1 Tax=Porphyromonas sp. TaxID=1924944 RepID=UPI0026DCF4FF|nr:dTDP-glucose 4,6-dehydratase [Porphyromonas sp.]MDO4695885.1 dTDP-glucose 4,6-dehydratase [Porphyromonas sp.]MDO4770511.1 dTDP-glucose 4,6-dehydratase [Porphyromonas sp.]